MEAIIVQGNAQIVDTATEVQAITDDLYTRFIDFVDASPKTIETYTRALRQFAKWLSFNGIGSPRREDVLQYRDELKETHKPSTVQNYITAVRLFFQWTEQEHLYPNVAEHIKGAKLDKSHKKDYLTSRQVKRVLEKAKGDDLESMRNYAMLALMFTGALRTIEVSRANVEDLRTAGDEMVLFVQGKGHEEKTDFVKIAPEVEEAIREYLTARGSQNPEEPLFTSLSNNSKGQRLSTRSISGIVKDAFQKAGYNSSKLTAHSTRHTSITLALLGGQSIQEAQQFARHTNINTTLIYSHNLDMAKNQCGATVAKAIF